MYLLDFYMSYVSMQAMIQLESAVVCAFKYSLPDIV